MEAPGGTFPGRLERFLSMPAYSGCCRVYNCPGTCTDRGGAATLGRVSLGERTGRCEATDADRKGPRHVHPARRQRAVIAKLLIVAVAVALGLVTVTSCSSDDDDSAAKDEPSRTTERQTTTTIDARAAEEAAVKEARQKAEEVWKDSAAAPDPDSGDPALAESYVGPMLDRLTTTLQAWKANGWASRY